MVQSGAPIRRLGSISTRPRAKREVLRVVAVWTRQLQRYEMALKISRPDNVIDLDTKDSAQSRQELAQLVGCRIRANFADNSTPAG